MAKLAAKAAQSAAPSPATPFSFQGNNFSNELEVLAGQVRRAIVSQCLPKLCTNCRRLIMKTNGSAQTLPRLELFCGKCKQVVLTLTTPRPQSQQSQQKLDTTVADRLYSFLQGLYSNLIGQQPPTVKPVMRNSPLVTISKKLPNKENIITRQKIDSSSVYPYLTALNRPWCRYCGVTVSSKWKCGPWGKVSLCCSHGPDDEGNEQFDLHRFEGEAQTRTAPILKDYCADCWKCVSHLSPADYSTCTGCSLSFHKTCSVKDPKKGLTEDGHWFCSPECVVDFKKKIVRGKIGFDERMPFTINPVAVSPRPVNKKPKHEAPPKANDIFVPKFVKVTPVRASMKRPLSDDVANEYIQMTDAQCHKRHQKYEATEKTNHLLRPHIMKKLFPKKNKK